MLSLKLPIAFSFVASYLGPYRRLQIPEALSLTRQQDEIFDTKVFQLEGLKAIDSGNLVAF